MKISVIHPSRSRPEMAKQTISKWVNRADNAFEYILMHDSDERKLYETINSEFGYPTVMVYTRDNKSAIEAINIGAKFAHGDILIIVSDDTDCPEHWDTLLLESLKDKSDYIVKTQDGLQKTLITMPIMDRAYYNRFGYIYHPDYLHMHCDEEMTIVGHMLDRVITLDLLFQHNHYTTGKMQMDAINVKNNSTWAHGQCTLDRRAKDNFGIVNPMVQRGDIQWR